MGRSAVPEDASVDGVARALADGTRRSILRLVHDGERTAGDIAGRFDVSRPAISQHLRVLHDAQLVSMRRQGTRRYYRARSEGLVGLRRWMEDFWTHSLDNLEIEVEEEQRRRSAAAGEGSAP